MILFALELLLPMCLPLGPGPLASGRADSDAELLSLECIWQKSPHNAFTDLIRFEGRFVCAFREGRGHVSTDGRLRVLASTEGKEWESLASIALEGVDLRDASLSVTPDGRLMLVGGAARRDEDGAAVPVGTIASFSSDGRHWSEPEWIIPEGRWMWRCHWHLGQAYGVSYSAGDKRPFLELHQSLDGHDFQVWTSPFFGLGRPSEVALASGSDGRLLCLIRRDREDNTAYLGIASAPYRKWVFRDLGVHVGGPTLLALPDGRWIAAGRRLAEKASDYRTVIYQLDPEAAELHELFVLPSGGDTSYPGLVWHQERLWVSYYSSHEGEQARIYFASLSI